MMIHTYNVNIKNYCKTPCKTHIIGPETADILILVPGAWEKVNKVIPLTSPPKRPYLAYNGWLKIMCFLFFNE